VVGGQARCWGGNDAGQVGDGTVQPRYRPTVVKNGAASGPLTGVAQVVAGGRTHTCARLASGQARCWGGNTNRELGHGTSPNAVLPVAVTNAAGTGRLTGIRQLTAGWGTTCAALMNGQARCWGANGAGQLGRGFEGPGLRRPKAVRNPLGTGPLTGVTQIDMEYVTACARLTTGQLRCWGYGEDGQLGNGTAEHRALPVRVQV
jgi:alpha-tubulin suppressor-like RCC1 family protein